MTSSFLLLLHKIHVCKKSAECIYNFLDVFLSRDDNVALDDLCGISSLMDGSSFISYYLSVALHLGVVPCGTSQSTLACQLLSLGRSSICLGNHIVESLLVRLLCCGLRTQAGSRLPALLALRIFF